MRLESMAVVAKREFLQRIKGKAFWLGTLVLPLFLAAMMILPGLLLVRSEARQKIVVVDATGVVARELEVVRTASAEKLDPAAPSKPRRRAVFDVLTEAPRADAAAQRAALDRRVLDEKIDAWVWIGDEALAEGRVEYHARSVSNFLTQEELRDDLSTAVRRLRLRSAGVDPERVAELMRPVQLQALRVSEEGSREEGEIAGVIFPIVLFMLLYVTIAIWGQQVLTGVLEEKGSRIIEVMISTIKPIDLMVGKLVGICLLGLTQITIWFGVMAALSAPGVLAAVASLPEDASLPRMTPAMVFHFAAFFALGFFVFATFYAAVGAASNNLQEAQQVASVIVFFLVAPIFFMYRIINDPESTLAVVTSLIPPFTPLLMTLRIAVRMPPLWQIALSYVLTLGFIGLMLWLCARIYRVGILMYGKKPTFQELWRWLRYA